MLDNPQHAHILSLLKGVNSQKPMPFHDLQGLAHSGAAELHAVLDEMYAAHSINQALVTRSGLEQREVWLTGIEARVPYGRAAAVLPPTPVRRAEVKTAPPVDKALQAYSDLSAQQNERPRALQVLEYIEANPGCNNEEISQHFSFASPVSYIKKHVEKQKLRRTYISNRVAIYHLEDGLTAASIYGNGIKNNHGHARKVLKAQSKEPSKVPVKNITVQACRPEDKAMLATDAGKEMVEKAIKKLGMEPIAKLDSLPKLIDQPEANQLNIAYTNQNRIIIFGLTDIPIELSHEDSVELISFCAKMDLCRSYGVPVL